MSTASRTVNAYAAFEPSGEFRQWQYASRTLGDADIEIKISHCGICGSDLHHLDEGWHKTAFPLATRSSVTSQPSVRTSRAWLSATASASEP